MNEMCRLCLSVPSEKMRKLSEECDILLKIKNHLSLELILNKSLPSQICCICVNKIEDIHSYHKKVNGNQEIILKMTKDNDFEKNKFNIEYKLQNNTCDTVHDASSFSDRESVKDEPNSSSDNEILSKLKKDKVHRCQHIELHQTKKRKINKLDKAKSNSENIQHNCLMCFKDYKSQNDLAKHYIDHEEIIANDNNTSQSANNAVDRYKTKTSDDAKISFECCTCGQSYDKNKDILEHVESHLRPFICKLCGRTYKSVHEIIRHGRTHNGQNFHCSYRCGFSSVYKGALKDHEKRHGNPEFKFTCDKCGKGFQVKTWHDQHQNIHSGLKPFVCNICGVAFHMDRYLTAHRSKMHPQTSAVKRHVCVKCLMPCDSRNSLKRHMEVHGVKSTLLCDLCGKVFANSELLKYHKNGHLGVKPYTCSICNKKFAKKFNLKIHELTHTGARAHVCLHCGKCFTQSSALRRHTRRHHPEIQFKENVVTSAVDSK